MSALRPANRPYRLCLTRADISGFISERYADVVRPKNLSRRPAQLWIASFEEVSDRDTQRPGNPYYVQDRAIPHAPFDTTHVAAPEIRRVGEGLLRQVTFLAKLSDSISEPL